MERIFFCENGSFSGVGRVFFDYRRKSLLSKLRNLLVLLEVIVVYSLKQSCHGLVVQFTGFAIG